MMPTRGAAVGNTWNQGGGLSSSVRMDWATPRRLFEMLDQEFHFTLDVCATEDTAVCPEWFGSGALDRPWVPLVDGAVFCNPPYGKLIGKWIEKAYRESIGRKYGTVVLLIPARTDTSWWHDYCMKGEIRFLRGRLNFDDTRRARAPFPSAIVIFRGRP